jgi:hypothetical protein
MEDDHSRFFLELATHMLYFHNFPCHTLILDSTLRTLGSGAPMRGTSMEDMSAVWKHFVCNLIPKNTCHLYGKYWQCSCVGDNNNKNTPLMCES